MLIAQISDPHVTTEGTAVRALVDTPQRFADAVVTCAALPKVPDVILLTGDLVNDGTAEEYALLAEALAEAPCPVLPIPGNHDDPLLLHATFAALDVCGAARPAVGPLPHVVVTTPCAWSPSFHRRRPPPRAGHRAGAAGSTPPWPPPPDVSTMRISCTACHARPGRGDGSASSGANRTSSAGVRRASPRRCCGWCRDTSTATSGSPGHLSP